MAATVKAKEVVDLEVAQMEVAGLGLEEGLGEAQLAEEEATAARVGGRETAQEEGGKGVAG